MATQTAQKHASAAKKHIDALSKIAHKPRKTTKKRATKRRAKK
jgi:hypothetical protein